MLWNERVLKFVINVWAVGLPCSRDVKAEGTPTEVSVPPCDKEKVLNLTETSWGSETDDLQIAEWKDYLNCFHV